MPDLTVAEYARRWGVARSTVARVLARAQQRAEAAERAGDTDPDRPPAPVNPGEPQQRYPSQEMDAWWPRRRGPGRPPKAAAPTEEAS